MEINKKYVLSYPDSMKIIDEAVKKDKAINNLMYMMEEKTHEQIVDTVNKCLIETANKMNVSLYYLCFHTIPDFDWGKQTVRLAPVEFDLTHDGGYWKNKYYQLKKEIQDVLIGNQET